MLRVVLITCTLLVSGCGLSPLSLLTGGGGPNVAANVQAGKTNSQTIGQTTLTEQTVKAETVETIEQSSGATSVRTEKVEKITVNETDKWLLALLLLFAGFVIPSPSEIFRGARRAFKSVFKCKGKGADKVAVKVSEQPRDPKLEPFFSTRTEENYKLRKK